MEAPTGYDADMANRPSTIADLIVELRRVSKLPPVERARVIPGLIDVAKSVLAQERGAAMDEGVKGGLTTVALAAELGIHRSKVADALRLARGESSS